MLHKKYFLPCLAIFQTFRMAGAPITRNYIFIFGPRTDNKKSFDIFTQFRDRAPFWSGYEVKMHEAAAHMQIYAIT